MNKKIIAIIVLVVVIAAAGSAYYYGTKKKSAPVLPKANDLTQALPGKTAPDDTTAVIEKDIENADLGNLDSEFKDIDTELNKL